MRPPRNNPSAKNLERRRANSRGCFRDRQSTAIYFPSKRAGAVRVDLSSYFKIPGPTNARLLLSSSLPPVSTRARVAPRVARRPAPRPLRGLGPSVVLSVVSREPVAVPVDHVLVLLRVVIPA